MKKILITGGAGYIGSIMVHRLLDQGYQVVVIDSLERSSGESLDTRAEFVKGDLRDREFVNSFFENRSFDGVIYFAGYISMGESMQNPYIYFENNVYGVLHVLEAMQKKSINNFIFSSTAGVYGNPIQVPIPEDHPKNPTNPYGESKLIVEQILKWYSAVYKLSSMCLRYFNACGALEDGSLGEAHIPETHIIPNAIHAVLEDREFVLFGTDYDTKDGTAVRDYIHVIDLVEAHILGLEQLWKKEGHYIYNVGTGEGHSNQDILKMVEKVSGKYLKVKNEVRRPGDAQVLVADASKIKSDLGFVPRYSDLETIVKTAYIWHTKKR